MNDLNDWFGRFAPPRRSFRAAVERARWSCGGVVGRGCSSHKDSIPPFRILFLFRCAWFRVWEARKCTRDCCRRFGGSSRNPVPPGTDKTCTGVHTLTGDKERDFLRFLFFFSVIFFIAGECRLLGILIKVGPRARFLLIQSRQSREETNSCCTAGGIDLMCVVCSSCNYFRCRFLRYSLRWPEQKCISRY